MINGEAEKLLVIASNLDDDVAALAVFRAAMRLQGTPELDARGRIEAQGDAGLRLRVARARLRLSQQELATRMGIAAPSISRWEHGHTPMSLRSIARAEEAIGVPLAEWPT